MSSFFFVSAIGFSRLSMLFLAIPGDCIWYSLRLLRCFWYGDADDDGEWLHNTHTHTHAVGVVWKVAAGKHNASFEHLATIRRMVEWCRQLWATQPSPHPVMDKMREYRAVPNICTQFRGRAVIKCLILSARNATKE